MGLFGKACGVVVRRSIHDDKGKNCRGPSGDHQAREHDHNPRRSAVDLRKALPRKVESSDIYMGAIPWIFIQLILVAVVIFFPQTLTIFLDK